MQCELAKTPKELPAGQLIYSPGGVVLGITQHPTPNPKFEELKKRSRELLRDGYPPNYWRWGGDTLAQNDRNRYTYARGFIEEVTCPDADWVRHGDAIVSAHPVRWVRISLEGDALPKHVFALWERRMGRSTIGKTLSDCFRDLWECELLPVGWGTSDASPVDDLRAMRDLLYRNTGGPIVPPSGFLARPGSV